MKPATIRRVYLREAAVALLLARLGLRLLSLRRIFAWAGRPPRRIRRFAADEADWIAWAVDTLGARMNLPGLPRALATHAMLRRHGIASRLCLGFGQDGHGLTPQAWVEVGGDGIAGAPDTVTRLAAFGRTPS
ncbi:MAG TPA: lasso peptide biosynthesis B2 protein [Pseudolabrys sp.]|nr:lasso peptide biosynthesis B2 protein [Pseudolabrys sp.]